MLYWPKVLLNPMLFNSFSFIFIFLPLALLLFHLPLRYGRFRLALTLLVLCSLSFYAYWYPPYLAILLLSIFVNFNLARFLQKIDKPIKKFVFWFGVIFNLGLISYFKYYFFFLDNISFIIGHVFDSKNILLPLGISFFTFQQIAYLLEVYKAKVSNTNFVDYLLFVSFFPQLIAGPIVHFNQVMPQFLALKKNIIENALFSSGLALFSMGLFKKVVMADYLATHADPLFVAVEAGYRPTFLEAWGAAFSYSFQIYFDFSGYTDMALGLALLFGIRLPQNFNAPYKATGYIQFWKRWHITLSNFLRDYVYIPLGGNRSGATHKYSNILITMLIGGLWHGASWNFVLWGGLHGIFIGINHLIRHVIGDFQSFLLSTLGWLVTFVSVTVLWVLFRAESFHGAISIYYGMSSFVSISLPESIFIVLPEKIQSILLLLNFKSSTNLLYFKSTPLIMALALAGLVAFLLPNSSRLFRVSTTSEVSTIFGQSLRFAPNFGWAIFTALMLVLSITFMQRQSPFLYFQF